MNVPFGGAIDPISGKVFVADANNKRVLRFASGAALINGAAADGVLGQPNFSSSIIATSASGMYNPFGLAADSAGRLWVADASNSRVLRFGDAVMPTLTWDTPAAIPYGTALSSVQLNASVTAHASIDVDPAALTITADDKARAIGAANPALTATYTGFVNGDTAASLDAPAVLTTGATSNSLPGAYPITASGAADANYTSTFTPGTLAVAPFRIYVASMHR